MSDPSREGPYECHGPMQPIALEELAGDQIVAHLCNECLKFRHALPPGDPLRPKVVAIMEPITRQMYLKRQAVGE